MKKVFLIAASIFAMVSCAKVNVTAPSAADVDQEVDFQVVTAISSTKADTFTGVLFEEDAFGAYAWQKDNNGYIMDGENAKYFMNAQKISKQTVDSKSVWKADGARYYWPKSNKIDFVCWAPYVDNQACWFTIGNGTSGYVNTLSATRSNVNGSTTDLMFSDKAVDCTTSNTNQVLDGSTTNAYNGVPVIFRHALAKTKVQVKAILVNDLQDNVAEITWIEGGLKNIYKNGSLNMTLSTTGETNNTKQWYTSNYVWSPVSETSGNREDIAFTWPSTTDFNIPDTETDVMSERMVLPQALTEYTAAELAANPNLTDQEIYIKVHVKVYTGEENLDNIHTENVSVKDGAASYIDEDYSKTVKLSSMVNSSNDKIKYWKMGTRTHYLITIDPFSNEITFDPCVVDWTTVDANGTIVITQQ